MPKRKNPEETPEEQFKRFVKTAREHDLDEGGEEFERAFKKIVKIGEKEVSTGQEKPSSKKR